MVEYKDGGWWRFNGRECWTRDTPNWKELHPLGPAHFDLMCPECDWILSDIRDPEDKSTLKKILTHFFQAHEIYRLAASAGLMLGNGEGI